MSFVCGLENMFYRENPDLKARHEADRRMLKEIDALQNLSLYKKNSNDLLLNKLYRRS